MLTTLTKHPLLSCWLVEMAKESPPTWQFEGVDVSSLNFPAKEYLPTNVSLGSVDVFEDVPGGMVERYDVVHVRAFGVVIKYSNPMPLLKNLVSMLSRNILCFDEEQPLLVWLHIHSLITYIIEPGGYLQWDEFDCATFHAHAPTYHTEKKHCEELLRMWQSFAQKTNLDFK